MKTTCLLLSSVLLLGCLSACNIFTQKQKALKTNDGSITTVETDGNELTVCDFALAKDTRRAAQRICRRLPHHTFRQL